MSCRFVILPLCLMILLSAIVVRSQQERCQAIVEQAWTSLAQRCDGIQRDELCYGHPTVEASLTSDIAFDSPGARANLKQLQTLRAAALDLEADSFGIALMRLGVNAPVSQPGAGSLMLLAGGASIVHEADRARIPAIGEPLSSATLASTPLYANPSIVAESRGQLPPDTIALVDARDATGEWLRLVDENDGAVAWVQREKLARVGAMDGLPVIEAGDPFAMRDFTFAAGVDYPECDAATPLLLIQTPQDQAIDLRLNGDDIQVTGLLSLTQAHTNAISLTAHRGFATLSSGATVDAGKTAIAITGARNGDSNAILGWSGALPVSDTELRRGEVVQARMNELARGNGWDEYSGDLAGGEAIHTVVYGDSLYAIARHYDVRVDDLIRANGHRAPFSLFAGMEIIIPRDSAGFGGLRQMRLPAATESTNDCGGLRLTSPLHRAPGGMSDYYWDGIAAADSYRVDVYDSATDVLVGTFTSSATSIRFSAGQLGVGGAMQWEVTALADGQPICSTGRSAPMPHVSA